MARPQATPNDAGDRLAGIHLPADESPSHRPDDLIDPATAAELAGCSVRTIRRAYRGGALLAYRDGNGRAVRIRYADLRAWLTHSSAARPEPRRPARAALRANSPRPWERRAEPPNNLALLRAAREELLRRAHGGAAAPPAGGRPAARG